MFVYFQKRKSPLASVPPHFYVSMLTHWYELFKHQPCGVSVFSTSTKRVITCICETGAEDWTVVARTTHILLLLLVPLLWTPLLELRCAGSATRCLYFACCNKRTYRYINVFSVCSCKRHFACCPAQKKPLFFLILLEGVGFYAFKKSSLTNCLEI